MTPSVARPAFDSAAWRDAVALRRRVLRTPLGLDFTADELARESEHLMLVLQEHARVVATLLLVWPVAGMADARLRQMAVAPERQGRGYGASLMRQAEAEASRLGATAIVLHARASARAFYARLGYRAEGASFVEVTLEHVRMRRTLGGGEA